MRSRLRAIFLPGLVLFIIVAGCTSALAEPTQEDITLETLVAGVPLTEQAIASLTPNTATPTLSPTPTETLVPTPTFTPSPTLTPTRPPEDPRWRLGEPDWIHTFDTGDNWYTYESVRSKAVVADGRFFYTVFVNDSMAERFLAGPTIGNFYLEVTAQTPPECSGKDRYGVLFRAPNPNEGYLFNLSCDGQYRLVTIDLSGVRILSPWTTHSAILPGPNQVNRLGIWASRKVIQIYANGIPLAGLPDESTYIQPGRFGLSVASENTPNFTVIFDDIQFWSLP
jgi:hypothetical protein